MRILSIIYLVASIALFLTVLSIAIPAHATGSKPTQNKHQSQSTKIHNSVSAGAVAGAVSGSASSAKVGDVLATGIAGSASSVSHGGIGYGGSATGGRANASNGDQTMNVNYDTDYRDRVPDVHAAALTTGDCLGSWSGGASGSAFGLSFGKTVLDEDCNTRMNAILMVRLGHPPVAVEVMCGIEEVAAADERSGSAICAENQPEILAEGVLDMQPNQLAVTNDSHISWISDR